MRRMAGIGFVTLALAACQALPALVRVEVDGSTVEYKKKVPPPQEPPAGAPDSGTDAPAS